MIELTEELYSKLTLAIYDASRIFETAKRNHPTTYTRYRLHRIDNDAGNELEVPLLKDLYIFRNK